MKSSSTTEALFYIGVTAAIIGIIMLIVLGYFKWLNDQKRIVACKNRLGEYCNSLIGGYSPDWYTVRKGCEDILPSDAYSIEDCKNLMKKITEIA